MGGAQSCEGRYHEHTLGVAVAALEGGLSFCGVSNQIELVAQPLNGHTSDKNTAL